MLDEPDDVFEGVSEEETDLVGELARSVQPAFEIGPADAMVQTLDAAGEAIGVVPRFSEIGCYVGLPDAFAEDGGAVDEQQRSRFPPCENLETYATRLEPRSTGVEQARLAFESRRFAGDGEESRRLKAGKGRRAVAHDLSLERADRRGLFFHNAPYPRRRANLTEGCRALRLGKFDQLAVEQSKLWITYRREGGSSQGKKTVGEENARIPKPLASSVGRRACESCGRVGGLTRTAVPVPKPQPFFRRVARCGHCLGCAAVL